jgi:ribosomal protein S18 acetylase RimI-like enzyme
VNSPRTLSQQEFKALFTLDRLDSAVGLTFDCSIPEYSAYLERDALRSQEDRISVTYLLHERSTGAIVAYMSLIADAIKLNAAEKELHNLNYPFRTIPAMKIAKLAVADSCKKQYRGIGSYMIDIAIGIADTVYKNHFACRFITVDADIEHDPGVIAFYTKNGFIPNVEMNTKRTKTINMRKDILE